MARMSLSSPQAARSCVMGSPEDLSHEAFLCLFLDRTTDHVHQVPRNIFHGTIDAAPVFSARSSNQALVLDAAASGPRAQYPSGEAEPTAPTGPSRRSSRTPGAHRVRVLDRLVIGDGVATSIAERGLM